MKYIRKIDSIGRWDGTAEPLYDGAFSTGDILLSDLKTSHNTLSIWSYDTDEEKEEVLVAIALTRGHISKLAYVIMDDAKIHKLGIPMEIEEGISDGITRKDILLRHANLSYIDFWRLGFIAEYISELARNKEDRNQLSDKQVYLLIEKHIDNKNIDLTQVNCELRDSIERARERYKMKPNLSESK